jgi:hypothetical protein
MRVAEIMAGETMLLTTLADMKDRFGEAVLCQGHCAVYTCTGSLCISTVKCCTKAMSLVSFQTRNGLLNVRRMVVD